MKPFLLGSPVSVLDLSQVASGCRAARLPPSARARVARARRVLEGVIASGEPVYGVNTGFGQLASRRIPPEAIRTLQVNLVRSHACGVGAPLSPETARAIVFLRANELARGYSGCRPELVEFLVRLLSRGIVPVIPSRGSVGASGDLAPLAHAALVLLGEGRARVQTGGRWSAEMSAARALGLAGLQPMRLEAKEGLSLVNGTQAMQAVGALALFQARLVAAAADLAGAMSLEAIRGTPVAYEEALVRLKPHPGQMRVASRLRSLLEGSEIRESHRVGDVRVQDPYSFRCIPQVHGAVQESLEFAVAAVEREMRGVTDNPVVIGRRLVSGGNFHGQALSAAFDLAAIALTTLGNIAERRIAQLVSGGHGLPAFLADKPGLESGFMIAQVAAAALASENKVLAHPASIDTIPTSADQEDFVSMGMAAALKLETVLAHAAQIVAIELLAAARAVERRWPLRPGRGVQRGVERLRSEVPDGRGDAALSEALSKVKIMVLGGRFGPS
ncbi:MAG: histidine ammonia-lyase [Elusimicrobia bacterium]|nr:histidine ammonia-lyase [Elusimicrobiota bacterium]